MRALICLHGLLSSKKDFSFINKSLQYKYDKIACYDLPGHGTNGLAYNTRNIQQFILGIYDSLAAKYEYIDVIGYSMGGVMACYLQSVRRVHKLVLLSPSYRYLNFKNYHYTKQPSKKKERIISILPKKNYFHVFRFAKIMSDLSDEFHLIYPETLIIWGTEDYLVKEESGHMLYQMVQNRNKRLIHLQGHNHFNIVYSQAVLDLIQDFL